MQQHCGCPRREPAGALAQPLRHGRPAARLALLLLVGAAVPLPALGQRAHRSVLAYQGGIGLSATAVETRKAVAGGFPAHGFGVQLDFALRAGEVFAARAEAGLTFLGPVCFDEDTGCPARQRSASFLMLSGSLAAGLFAPPLALGPHADGVRLALGVYGGQEWVDAWRGTRNCVNCRAAGLGLRGGLYVEPALELAFLPGLGLGVYYRAYHRQADLRGRLTLRLIAGARP